MKSNAFSKGTVGALALGFMLFSVPSARADVLEKGLYCNVKSQYLNIAGTLEIDLSKDSIVNQRTSRRTGEKVLSWSQSECEDSTEVRFSGEDFQKVSKGEIKKIHGSLKHEEADGKIELPVTCTWQEH